MKILITENQLEKVIYNFINREFGALRKVKFKNNDDYLFGGSIFFINKNNKIRIELNYENNLFLYVDDVLELSEVFHRSEKESKMFLYSWVKEFLKIKNITGIRIISYRWTNISYNGKEMVKI